jgi:hypothetical protein
VGLRCNRIWPSPLVSFACSAYPFSRFLALLSSICSLAFSSPTKENERRDTLRHLNLSSCPNSFVFLGMEESKSQQRQSPIASSHAPWGAKWRQERNVWSHFLTVPFGSKTKRSYFLSLLPFASPTSSICRSSENPGQVLLSDRCQQKTNPAAPGSHQPCHLSEWLSWHRKAGPNQLWLIWMCKYIYVSQCHGPFPGQVLHEESPLRGRTNRSSVSRSISR